MASGAKFDEETVQDGETETSELMNSQLLSETRSGIQYP